MCTDKAISFPALSLSASIFLINTSNTNILFSCSRLLSIYLFQCSVDLHPLQCQKSQPHFLGYPVSHWVHTCFPHREGRPFWYRSLKSAFCRHFHCAAYTTVPMKHDGAGGQGNEKAYSVRCFPPHLHVCGWAIHRHYVISLNGTRVCEEEAVWKCVKGWPVTGVLMPALSLLWHALTSHLLMPLFPHLWNRDKFAYPVFQVLWFFDKIFYAITMQCCFPCPILSHYVSLQLVLSVAKLVHGHLKESNIFHSRTAEALQCSLTCR